MSSVVALVPEEGVGVVVATNAEFNERAGFESVYLVNAIASNRPVECALPTNARTKSSQLLLRQNVPCTPNVQVAPKTW